MMKRILALLFLFQACKSPVENSVNNSQTEEQEDIVLVSDQKLSEISLQIGSLIKTSFGKEIKCNGFIEAGPNSQITISPLLPGQVKRVHVKLGDNVREGQILATMQDQSYLDLKQEFFETKSTYEYFREDFKRQGELTIENAASIKQLQQSKRDFEIYEAKFKGLKAKLLMMGINPDSLRYEHINSLAYVLGSASGRVTKINVHIGTFCDSQYAMFELVNPNDLFAKLQVYEKDAPLIQNNQQVDIQLSLPGSKIFTGVIQSINKQIDNDTRSMSVHVKFNNTTDEIYPGTYLLAGIRIAQEISYVLPENGVVTQHGKSYIFTQLDSNRFRRHEVQIGDFQNGLYQILNPDVNLIGSKLVVNGAYYLNWELTDEEE